MKTISVVLEEVEQLLKMKYSGVTPQNYLLHIKRFLEFSNNVPTRVNNEDILNYNLSIVNKSESYRNVAINAIKAYFQLYLRKKVKGFSSIRPPKSFKKPNYIPHDYFIKCFEKVDNTKHRLLFLFGYQLGLRSNETRSIKVSDIELDEYRIKINGKGSKQRYVFINDYLYTIIVLYFEEYNPVNYFFEGQNGKYSQTSISNLMARYLKGYTYHNLRHTFAQTVLSNSGNLKLTADALGHSTTKTTEKFYVIGEAEKVSEYAPQFN